MNKNADPPTLRAYTAEEVREQLFAHMRHLCDVWSDPVRGETEVERMESLCFSILTLFDGTTRGFPGLDLRLSPHADDKQFAIERGKDRYYESGMVINEDWFLHDEWYESDNRTPNRED